MRPAGLVVVRGRRREILADARRSVEPPILDELHEDMKKGHVMTVARSLAVVIGAVLVCAALGIRAGNADRSGGRHGSGRAGGSLVLSALFLVPYGTHRQGQHVSAHGCASGSRAHRRISGAGTVRPGVHSARLPEDAGITVQLHARRIRRVDGVSQVALDGGESCANKQITGTGPWSTHRRCRALDRADGADR